MEDDVIGRASALRVLAFMGDLSMGQPVDHSPRVARGAAVLARELGLDAANVEAVRQVALLRWSGCTANAAEIAATIGDDVAGRAAMLALQFERIELLVPPATLGERVLLTTTIHCEVASTIARALGLDERVARSLDAVFEHWDGSGSPNGLRGEAIALPARIVAVCSEFEVLRRIYSPEAALRALQGRAGSIHAPALVAALGRALTSIDDEAEEPPPAADGAVPMHLLGTVIDLKLPWLTGHSAAVAERADALARQFGLAPALRAPLRRAAWLHGLGRAAIPNRIWSRGGPLGAADREAVRLYPYWTSRLAAQVATLAAEAALASSAQERLDGSGYFRGAAQAALGAEARILAVALAGTAMRAARPWREALPEAAALAALRAEAAVGRLDRTLVEACPGAPGREPAAAACTAEAALTPREIEVLRRISLGESNKRAAQQLGISPATVRTHLESVFRKLDCRTRAACILKASMAGMLAPWPRSP